MPALTIQGKKVNRVLDATVEITHGEAKEPMQIPTQQFVINLPLDYDTMIAEWALAPHGTQRWKTVELQTLDRSRKVNHTWTLHKAYVHSYKEKEFPPQSGSQTDQGNYIEVIVRGTLVHNNVDYDGKNILTVAAGEAEPIPPSQTTFARKCLFFAGSLISPQGKATGECKMPCKKKVRKKV